MATPTPSEIKSASWWNYFFLYDGSKVKGEGDPTRAGICYFYPSKTLLDQQELLCGQLAGVVRCLWDLSGTPPTLIRLRKLKFAIRVDGDYLWALGCGVELSDVSCRQFLDQLIGFFHFYMGPVSLAYKSRSQEELSLQWDTFITQVLRGTSESHRIFNALWNLDHTKVEPLLLLKAALILQTCQRSPHVLAGCILYKGLIVNSQLPPSLTAKVLLYQTAPEDQRLPGAGAPQQEAGAALPPNVQITPVFLSEEEVASLHEFTVEQKTRLQESSSQYPPWDRSTPTRAEDAWTSATILEPTPHDGAWLNGRGADGHLLGHEQQEHAAAAGLCATACGPGSGSSSSSLQQELGFSQEELDLSEIHISEAQEAFSPAPALGDQEAVFTSHQAPTLPEDTAVCSCLDPSPLERLPESRGLERLTDLPISNGQTQVPGMDPLPRRSSRPAVLPPQDPGAEQYRDGSHEHRSALACTLYSGDSRGPSTPADRIGFAPSPAGPYAGLLPMNLYTHSVNGLVLSLLGEEPLLRDTAAIEEVYHSSLASLNGLEVHLKETLPRDEACPTSSTYSFVHYDRIQSMLTANLSLVAAPQDRRFLQAINLVHSDFAQLPTLYEMTVRNASTAVYACCNPAQETYFQQLTPTTRSSGFPNPQDCAFSLAGKAKRKLLKHGVNLL
ncbi:Hermansky-Pudlak syndrome 4 protein isoform X1 [Cricetulus griseus]|uniref:HPS4, biogenesis of lysosomal organelles complex 3 subunit 2 n=1 Tax=Cricetulus griseus TaxID=10029 RepID=A0A061I8P4_CRIGR|nr:Hermansky-Pudlak syndrome 4 protein isoform X1 [Cricetulus griseus]XP_027271727.1 Hermansky-Pudlak syndrome 4 protein isoform X1 [Cricetulus griseus]XP_027271728.1 Hermansky-Pudlak syndrome 4 protein isoform X1 [Cricetulus griseus]XP_027271729.1 Hermansky-Pudlak syndrome 4 protein isoform X1 [Cricetulus griseus]XP_027271731.1 Hermansky-Pudlak syndrome 4 protein isoform X1 [Cricetulus griseus]XP_027271732.1 Hermansky-Pudlak syndrome 4 protein isoform X1 [Cricetulus griseus]XP_027295301.1 He